MPDMLVKLYELDDDWQFIIGQKNRGITIRKPIGPIRENSETRALLLGVMQEVVAVGRAHGVDLAEDYAEVRNLWESPGGVEIHELSKFFPGCNIRLDDDNRTEAKF